MYDHHHLFSSKYLKNEKNRRLYVSKGFCIVKLFLYSHILNFCKLNEKFTFYQKLCYRKLVDLIEANNFTFLRFLFVFYIFCIKKWIFNLQYCFFQLKRKICILLVYYVPRRIMRVIMWQATILAGDRSRGAISPASILSESRNYPNCVHWHIFYFMWLRRIYEFLCVHLNLI